MLQTGYQMSDLFSVMSMIACLIFLSGFILQAYIETQRNIMVLIA